MPTIRREIRGKILEIKRIPLFKIFGGTVMWLKFKRIEEGQMAKNNDCEATLRKGNLPKAEAVTEAKEDKGAALKAVLPQIESNGGHGSKCDCPGCCE